MYNSLADVQKFPISRSDGDNQGFEKSRARSPLASRTYRPGNTHLQYDKLSPDAALPSVVFAISDWKLHPKNLPNGEKCKPTHAHVLNCLLVLKRPDGETRQPNLTKLEDNVLTEKKKKRGISMTEELHRNQRSGITYAREKFMTRDTQRD